MSIALKTALLSVTDKTGIVELAQALHAQGVKLISTGGTRAVLENAGLPVVDITTVTGNPEAFGGRMKTISFQVASGILFDRTRDSAEASKLGIVPIDLVVANLYAFSEYKDKNLPLAELIEHIDVGGPTMIRAAAKNYAHVCVLTKPSQYAAFTRALSAGDITLEMRTDWMRDAFSLTAAYDTMIAEHLASTPLRYGENPHQTSAFSPAKDRVAFEVLGGKELSHNNLIDLDAALSAVRGLPAPSCAVVKHENPCGLASAASLKEALQLAWAGDPVSSFGSVIAFNRAVTSSDLAFLDLERKEIRKFVEIVAAPDFDAAAVELLKHNKNLRILKIADRVTASTPVRRHLDLGTLTQSRDAVLFEKLEVVSKAKPAVVDEALISFGLHAVRCIKSNAIAIVRRKGESLQLLGMGAGQPNRVKSTELAFAQAESNLAAEGTDVKVGLANAMLISDAFFPFADGPTHALTRGIRCIVQPGGSMRDGEVIAACDVAGAVLVMTGTRHFKH
jgi:phosphoribosylaminoimidazolecarboxamide formyltransferase / IMP cyclohydrolase